MLEGQILLDDAKLRSVASSQGQDLGELWRATAPRTAARGSNAPSRRGRGAGRNAIAAARMGSGCHARHTACVSAEFRTGFCNAHKRGLLAVAYDTLLRKGDLVAGKCRISWRNRRAVTGAGMCGKDDLEGPGAAVYLAHDSVALLREPRARSGVSEGRLFVRCPGARSASGLM